MIVASRGFDHVRSTLPSRTAAAKPFGCPGAVSAEAVSEAALEPVAFPARIWNAYVVPPDRLATVWLVVPEPLPAIAVQLP